MKTTCKRALSILLLIAMLTSMFCSVSFAEETDPLPYAKTRIVSDAVTDGDYDYYPVTLTVFALQDADSVTISDTLTVKDASISSNSKYSATADSTVDGNTISWTLSSIATGHTYELTYWYCLRNSGAGGESEEELVAKIPELLYTDSIPVYLYGKLNLLEIIDLSVSCDGTVNSDRVTEYSFYKNNSNASVDLIGTYRVPKGHTSGSWITGSASITVSDDLKSITVLRTVSRSSESIIDKAERNINIPLKFYHPHFTATPEDIHSTIGSTETLNNAGPNVNNGIIYTVEWFDSDETLLTSSIPSSVPAIVPACYAVSLVGSTDISGSIYYSASSDGAFESVASGITGSKISYTLGSRDTDFKIQSLTYMIGETIYTATIGKDLTVIPASGEHSVTPADHDFTVYSNPVKVTYNDDGLPSTLPVSTESFHNGLSIKINPNNGKLDDNPSTQILPLTADKTLADPVREHYIFKGWELSPQFPDASNPNLIYTFTAQWEPDPEDVVYKDADDDKKDNTQVVSYLDKIQVDPNEGIWSPDDTLKASVSDPVLNDSYEEPVVITVPTDIELLEDPVRTGYTFNGWRKTPGTGEIKYVFTAQWTANPEDVVYKDADDDKKDHTQVVDYSDKIKVDPNNGIWSPDDTLKSSITEPKLNDTYEEPVVITVPTDIELLEDPVREHYSFLGWKKTPGTDGIKYVFTAQWAIDPEDVVYKDADDDKKDHTQVVDYSDKIKVDPNNGIWSPDDTLKSSITEPKLNDTYEEPVVITVPTDIELLEDPVRTGYTFTGWKKTPGTDGIRYVFTAQWTINPEDVVYKDADDNKNDHTQVVDYSDKIKVDPNNGIWSPDDTLKSSITEPKLNDTYEEPVVITVPTDIELLEDPVRENYTFLGWKKTPGTDGIRYVFTAQWAANPEDVVYKDADDDKNNHTQVVEYLDKIFVDPNNGTWSPDDTIKAAVSDPVLNDTYETPVIITVTADIELLDDPVRDGYTFLGWKKTPGEGDIQYVFTAQWEELNYTLEITKVDSKDETVVLPYAIFELYKVNGDTDELISTLTTNAQGTASVEHLKTGSYYLKEITAPAKYKLSEDLIEFVIEKGKLETKITCSNELKDASELLSDEHYAYIIGRDDGLIHPDASITRAEVATIFFRLLDDDVRNFYLTQQNNFSDVSSGQWYNCAISTMANMGIINGYEDGTFRPDNPITRAEFATIASRFDTVKNTTDVGFTDLEGHWAKKYINAAANRGWVNGYTDGTFRPDNLITRAEAMALVNRVANRNPKRAENLLDNMICWPDNMDTTLWYYYDVQEATNSHKYSRNKDGTEKWTEFMEPRDWKALEQ